MFDGYDGYNPEKFLLRIEKWVKVVHVSDANKDYAHLPIGYGRIDFNSSSTIFRRMKVLFVFEVYYEYQDKIEESLTRIKNLFC